MKAERDCQCVSCGAFIAEGEECIEDCGMIFCDRECIRDFEDNEDEDEDDDF